MTWQLYCSLAINWSPLSECRMLSLLVKQELITFLFHDYYAMETVIIVNSLPSKQKKMFDLSRL